MPSVENLVMDHTLKGGTTAIMSATIHNEQAGFVRHRGWRVRDTEVGGGGGERGRDLAMAIGQALEATARTTGNRLMDRSNATTI